MKDLQTTITNEAPQAAIYTQKVTPFHLFASWLESCFGCEAFPTYLLYFRRNIMFITITDTQSLLHHTVLLLGDQLPFPFIIQYMFKGIFRQTACITDSGLQGITSAPHTPLPPNHCGSWLELLKNLVSGTIPTSLTPCDEKKSP